MRDAKGQLVSADELLAKKAEKRRKRHERNAKAPRRKPSEKHYGMALWLANRPSIEHVCKFDLAAWRQRNRGVPHPSEVVMAQIEEQLGCS